MGQTGGVILSGGYIKLYRSLMDWEWYQDANVMRVFLHLLLEANHKPNKWQGIVVQTGQTVTSRHIMAQKLGISDQQIRTAIKKLKKTGEITSTATNRYTLVTVANWASYQSLETESTSNVTYKQPTDNQQITTNKNDKNDKKNIYGSFSNVTLTDDELQKLKERFSDWQKKIDDLSAYIASRGKRYASHYATILTWARRDEPSEEVKKKKYVN